MKPGDAPRVTLPSSPLSIYSLTLFSFSLSLSLFFANVLQQGGKNPAIHIPKLADHRSFFSLESSASPAVLAAQGPHHWSNPSQRLCTCLAPEQLPNQKTASNSQAQKRFPILEGNHAHKEARKRISAPSCSQKPLWTSYLLPFGQQWPVLTGSLHPGFAGPAEGPSCNQRCTR